jgi:hypothetical protein
LTIEERRGKEREKDREKKIGKKREKSTNIILNIKN